MLGQFLALCWAVSNPPPRLLSTEKELGLQQKRSCSTSAQVLRDPAGKCCNQITQGAGLGGAVPNGSEGSPNHPEESFLTKPGAPLNVVILKAQRSFPGAIHLLALRLQWPNHGWGRGGLPALHLYQKPGSRTAEQGQKNDVATC